MYKAFAVVVILFCSQSVAAWTYADQAAWKNVANSAICGSGTKQSPIDVKRTTMVQSTTLKDITGSYTTVSSGAKIKNDGGHTQKVMPKTDTNFGTTTWDSKEYTMIQFHSHQPSEHTFDGMRYDMELHFVHQQGTNSDYLVLTLYYFISGEDNAFLNKVKYSSGSSTADATVDITDSFNVWDALQYGTDETKEYITYSGGFTTPPCTEAVTFVLFRDYLTMSKTQWDNYAKTITDTISYTSGTGNARNVQAVNSRTITLQYGSLKHSNLLKVGLSMIIAALFFLN
jgi:carbonic anhydrase